MYDMLCAADSIGVFQVESRAQIATLPRLKPRCFYDLAIEVALIRPGPIQGDSVHPYIRRKHGEEAVTFAHPSLEEPLGRTLGVPLFQEQLMQIAVAVADFTPAEADQLRRAMGSKRSKDKIDAMRIRLFDGMAAQGHHRTYRGRDLREDQGLRGVRLRRVALDQLRVAGVRVVLAQAALSRGVLRGAAQRAADGLLLAAVARARRKRHGIEVRKPSLAVSAAECVARAGRRRRPSAGACTRRNRPCGSGCRRCARSATTSPTRSSPSREADGPFTSMADLARRVGMSADQVEALATADAFEDFGLPRREALWAAGAAAASRPGQLDVAGALRGGTGRHPRR